MSLNKKELIFSESKDKEWGKGAIRYNIHYKDKNVASAVVRPNPRKELGGMTLSDLQVKKDFRGQGLGRILLKHVIDKHQNDELYLRPQPYKSNEISENDLRKFYESEGFVPEGKELMVFKKAKILDANFIKKSQVRRNYDYGEGMYMNLDKYKSVADFRKKRRQKRKKDIENILNTRPDRYKAN